MIILYFFTFFSGERLKTLKAANSAMIVFPDPVGDPIRILLSEL